MHPESGALVLTSENLESLLAYVTQLDYLFLFNKYFGFPIEGNFTCVIVKNITSKYSSHMTNTKIYLNWKYEK